MDPWEQEIDFEIVINTLTLSVTDTKVIQLNGFCGLKDNMKTESNVPENKKGVLMVLDNFKYGFAYGINKEDLPVYVNVQTGWVCIGNPQKKGNAVEFINNCVAVIDDDNEFISLWLKPNLLPPM
ncbi:MAG: hypothetical protein SFY32_00150 [Bacteroidota bacterium]|nr:hypothetical protein [Bacteroidota bacterium]